MLIIFGANGPSGRQLIQQLSPLERETTVAALRLPEQQSDDFFANQHIRTTVVDTLDAEAVAQAVRHAEQAGCGLEDLPLTVLQGFSTLIENDVYQVLTPEGSLNARNHLGGTAPEQVKFQVARWRELLAADA